MGLIAALVGHNVLPLLMISGTLLQVVIGLHPDLWQKIFPVT